MNNPALNCNIGKMYIPNIFNHLLGTINNCSAEISTNPNVPPNPPTTTALGLLGQFIYITKLLN